MTSQSPVRLQLGSDGWITPRVMPGNEPARVSTLAAADAERGNNPVMRPPQHRMTRAEESRSAPR